jgi:hypothetical protein
MWPLAEDQDLGDLPDVEFDDTDADGNEGSAGCPRPIIDAGPALNFLAINRERVLTGVVGRINTPETVGSKVLEKATRDPRFRTVSGVWAKMRPEWIELLSDNETPEVASVVGRLSQLPMAERKMTAKDLGEIIENELDAYTSGFHSTPSASTSTRLLRWWAVGNRRMSHDFVSEFVGDAGESGGECRVGQRS